MPLAEAAHWHFSELYWIERAIVVLAFFQGAHHSPQFSSAPDSLYSIGAFWALSRR